MELVETQLPPLAMPDHALQVLDPSKLHSTSLLDVGVNVTGDPTVKDHKTAISIAWERHAAQFSEADRKRFGSFGQKNMNAYVEAINDACKKQKRTSKTFKVAEWFEPFFQVASLYLPAAQQIASVYPNPAPLILGGICCIMSMSSKFLSFQENLIKTLSKMSSKLKQILRYNQQIMHDFEVELTLIDIYGDILDFCKEALALLVNAEGERIGGMRTLGLTLRNPFDRKFGDLIYRFECHLDELQDKAIVCDRKIAQSTFVMQWQQTVDQRSNATDASAYHQNILAKLSQQQSHLIANQQFKERLENERRKKLVLEWLPSTAYLKHHEDLCIARLPGTGEWFLYHPSYLSWKDADDSVFLWVRGNPGCGKSVLASFAVNDLEEEMDDDGAVAVAFTYCKALEEDSKDAKRLACSLLKQLAQQIRTLDKLLEKMYNRGGNALQTGPDWSTITQSLKNALSDFTTVYIVVDGVDECVNHDELASLLVSLLVTLHVNVKILVFSRPNYAALERIFKDRNQLTIDSGETDTDIIKCIAAIVTAETLPVGTDTSLVDDVRAELLSKSAGSFLWVSLVVKALKDQSTPNQVRQAVKSVPSGLERMYDSALRRIASQKNSYKREAAFKLLVWTLNAARPLSRLEMLEALAVQSDMSHLDPRDIMPDARDLTASCADLVILNAEDYFVLRHSSLKEYLLELKRSEDEILEEFRLRQSNASNTILDTCLSYMLLDNFARPDGLDVSSLDALLLQHPFLNYAATQYFKHFQPPLPEPAVQKFCRLATAKGQRDLSMCLFHKLMLEEKLTDALNTTSLHFIAFHGTIEMASMIPSLKSFITVPDAQGYLPLDYSLTGSNRAMSMWLLETAEGFEVTNEPIVARKSLLHVAALFGWVDVLNEAIKQGYNKDFRIGEEMMTPLMTAADRGKEETMRALIQAGARLTLTSKSKKTALIYAVDSGHEKLWKPLLDAGSNVNAKGEEGATVLHYSMAKGSLGGIRLLLDYGADVNATAENLSYQTCLHLAAQHDRPQIVSLLLERKIPVDIPCDGGYTSFHLAAFNGSLNAAKQLVAGGAKVDALNEAGANAVHMAAQTDRHDFVKYLVEECGHQNRINAVDNYLWTPLHYAAANGSASTVFYLLEKGAAVDRSAKTTNQTALILAVSKNHVDVVTFLLAKGASCNVKGIMDWPPLHYAAYNDHPHFVSPLATRGADPNAKDEQEQTALHVSASKGHVDFVKQLFEVFPNLDVDSKDNCGHSAIHLASIFGSAPVVEYLLTEKQASIDANNNGELPLNVAAWIGHEDVVRLLLTAKNANTKGFKERSPLYGAVVNGHYGIVKLLLDNGAQPNATDNDGYHAIITATARKHFQVVNLLLANGASASCANPDNRTLLHAAANSGDVELVEQLLEQGCDGLAVQTRGFTPFLNAARNDYHEIVDLLIKRGFNGCQIADKSGKNCIHAAAGKGNLKMLSKLIREGADVLARDRIGRNAIHFAARKGHKDMILALHKLDVPCNIHSDLQQTPLMYAVQSRSVETVKLLLKLCPDQDLDVLSSTWQETALGFAASTRAWKIARILRSAGANPGKRDCFDENSWHKAAGHSLTMQALQDEEKTGPNEALDEKHRPAVLRKTICKFAKTLIAEASPRTVRQESLRVSLVRAIGIALYLLNPELYKTEAIFCFYEAFFGRRDMNFQFTYECANCGKGFFSGNIYDCVTCFETCLCQYCYKKYSESNKNSPPEAFLVLESLERDLQPLRAAVQDLHSNISDIAKAMSRFDQIRHWMSYKAASYEDWGKTHNANGVYNDCERPGEEFLKLILKSQKAIETAVDSSDDTDTGILQGVSLEDQWDKLCRKHVGDCEHYDFPCAGHEYLCIDPTAWETAKEDRDVFGEDGRVLHSWLKALLRKIDVTGAGAEVSARGKANKWPPPSNDAQQENTAPLPTVFEVLHLDVPIAIYRTNRYPMDWQGSHYYASSSNPQSAALRSDLTTRVDQVGKETLKNGSSLPKGHAMRRSATEPVTKRPSQTNLVIAVGRHNNIRAVRKESIQVPRAAARSETAPAVNHLPKREDDPSPEASPPALSSVFETPAFVEKPSGIEDTEGPALMRDSLYESMRPEASELQPNTNAVSEPTVKLTWTYNAQGSGIEDGDSPQSESMTSVTIEYSEDDLDAKIFGFALRLSDAIFPGFSASVFRAAEEELETESEQELEMEAEEELETEAEEELETEAEQEIDEEVEKTEQESDKDAEQAEEEGDCQNLVVQSMPMCGPFDLRNPWW